MNPSSTYQSFIKNFFSLISPESGCMRFIVYLTYSKWSVRWAKHLWFSSTCNKHQYSRNQLFINSQQKVNIPDPFQDFKICILFCHENEIAHLWNGVFQLFREFYVICYLSACLLQLLHPLCGFFSSHKYTLLRQVEYLSIYILFCLLCFYCGKDPIHGH
jgi:hypothetical protein